MSWDNFHKLKHKNLYAHVFITSDEVRYKHDCNSCIFLGQYYAYDLYFCPSGTVVARYGNRGYKYSSGIESNQLNLVEAKRRAIDKLYINFGKNVARSGVYINL
jgi:hypothetical protein